MIVLSNCERDYADLNREVFGMDRWFDAFYDCASYGYITKEEIMKLVAAQYEGKCGVQVTGVRKTSMQKTDWRAEDQYAEDRLCGDRRPRERLCRRKERRRAIYLVRLRIWLERRVPGGGDLRC